ncbi:hypothetical protein HGA91_04300 [candidate division WWE3 bacterium]|nr:hypothetical protein [candidate division WWE3 bacterium]
MNLIFTDRSAKQGQILVVILLIVIVGLTIALSIAGTTFRNLESTATTEETNRAFSAAEAGVEEAILKIEQGTPVPTINPKNLDSGSTIKQVTVQPDTTLQVNNLKKDDVAQLNLDCASCGTGQVRVQWDANTAIVVTKISGTSPNYNVERWAYNCGFNPGNGFTQSSAASGVCQQQFNVNGATDKILRFRVMYGDSDLSVTPLAGTTIPTQSTIVKATGQSGETERTVQLQRSAPVPPAILDYVLFSASGSLSK